MVLQTSRVVSLAGRFALTGVLTAVAVSWSACSKVPLLAPSGTVITLLADSTVLSLQGSTDVTAVLIENGQTSTGTGTGTGGTGTTGTTGAGTAVQDGTVVDFTTTLGTISPAEAKTSGGQVTVHLNAGTTSGTATVTAYSGGAKQTLTVTIGAAAVSSVSVSANPGGLPATGGTATLSALVLDADGNGVPNVPVGFSTTAGTLSAASATTGGSGVATVTLTTTAAAASAAQITITAAAGAKTGTATVTIDKTASATVSITPPTSAAVSTPATFTVATTATSAGGNASTVTDAVIDFGDGSTQDLGAIGAGTSVQHLYAASDVYKITVTVTTSDGVTQSGSSSVAVAPLTASLAASPATVSPNTPVTLTATVTPGGAWIDHYEWDFGDGSTDSTGANSDGHTYPVQGAYHVKVTVFPKYGDPLPPVTTTVTVVVGG